MIAKRKITRVVAIICAIILAFGLIFLFANEEERTNRDFTWLVYLILFLLELFIEIFFPEVDKKSLKKKRQIKRCKTMANENFNLIVDSKVEIKTLDGYVSGVLKSIDGDFLVVENEKKKVVDTYFVNKNSIETVKVTKNK